MSSSTGNLLRRGTRRQGGEIEPVNRMRMKPLVVGLTGGFATGKTTVAGILRRLGAQVLDCDRLAHQALIKGTPTYFRILKQLGRKTVCDSRGFIDREQLARVVFKDNRKRKRLERIIHPFVFKEIFRRIREGNRKVVVLEVPLLFETHFDREVDRIIVVEASRKQQLGRIKKKFGLGPAEARRRIEAQMPLAGKKARADFLIHNNGRLRDTAHQVRAVWRELKHKAR